MPLALAIVVLLIMAALYILILVGFVENVQALLTGTHDFWTVFWTTIEGLVLIDVAINPTNKKSN